MSHFNDLHEFRTDSNNNIVYKLVENGTNFKNVNQKITAYEYVDEKFVDTGFKCNYFANWVSMYFV